MWPLLFVVLSGPVSLEAPAEPTWGSPVAPAAVTAEAARGARIGWSSTRRSERIALLRRATRTVRLQLRSRTRRVVRRAESRRLRRVDAEASLRVQRGAAVARRVALRTRRARTPQRIGPGDPHPPAA